jgi:uncharacterized membrane protein
MSEFEQIDDYLRRLARHLSGLAPVDAQEVMREIRSHLEEAIALQRTAQQPIAVELLLAGFGSPRELAARYTAHILRGEPPPAGLPVIRRLRQQATRGLYYCTAVAGYGVTAALLLLIIGKTLLGSALGLWVDATGQVAVLGVFEQGPPGMSELLGAWLLPLAGALAIAAWLLTRRLLAALGPLA